MMHGPKSVKLQVLCFGKLFLRKLTFVDSHNMNLYTFQQVMRILLHIVKNFKIFKPSTSKVIVDVIFYGKASTFCLQRMALLAYARPWRLAPKGLK